MPKCNTAFLLAAVVLVVVTSFVIIARLGAIQLTAQIPLQCFAYGSGCAGCYLDAVLLEEFDGLPTHAAANHYVSALAVDEIRHHPGGVVFKIRIIHPVDRFDLVAFHIQENVSRTTTEVVADDRIHSVLIFG